MVTHHRPAENAACGFESAVAVTAELETQATAATELGYAAVPTTLVAKAAGGVPTVVGTVTLLDEDLPGRDAEFAPWVGDLVVAPKWRRRGIGTLLLKACVAAAKGFGFQSIALWCNAAHANTINFYARNGFVAIEEAVNPAGTEHGNVVIMRASIA